MMKENAYAVDVEAPEVGEVDKIFRMRDQRYERGELPTVLPEDEHKKHQKDGTYPKQPIPDLTVDNFGKPASAIPIGESTPHGIQIVGKLTNNPNTKLRKFSDINEGMPGGNHLQIGNNGIIKDEISSLIVTSENGMQDKRYCICAKQNDNRIYINCEDDCEWYHPACVGFDPGLFSNNKDAKFLCP